MNAYKKHLNLSTSTSPVDSLTSSEDHRQLDTWFAAVVEGPDLRDRVAVTGFNISRGVFGSISADLWAEPVANDED